MKVKVSSLKLNYNLYPREELDENNITRMIEALKAGVSLPPVLADKKTKIVIDGFHRREAYRLLYGEKSEIAVIYKEYTNIKDMFLDAVRLNASQGKTLGQNDRIHCQAIAKSLRIKPDFIANVLSITIENVCKPAATKIITEKIQRDPDCLVEQKQQRRTDRQIYYVRRVISFLENDKYDLDNPLLKSSLSRLMEILNGLY